MFNIQEVIFFILIFAAAVLAAYVLYAKYIAPRMGKSVPQELLDRARAMALDVVCYIEQILPGEMGIDKKLAARDKLKRLLDELHMNISQGTMDMLIEAAVFIMNAEILGNTNKYIKEGEKL